MKLNEKLYYPYFDYLRFILASVVMLGHDAVFKQHINLWHNAGNFCVQVFFVMSGFLIGSILINTPKSSMPRFYFNRAVRIWVPYFIALALLVIMSMLHDKVTAKWIEIVLYKLLFVYNLFGPDQLEHFRDLIPLQGTGNHFWSVNAEEQFYLIAPLILVFLPVLLGQSILVWGLLSLVALFTGVYASIILGVLAALIQHRLPDIWQHHSVKLLLFVLLGVCVFCLLKGNEYQWFAPLASVAIVLLLATPGVQTRLGEKLGGISYPLYLNHWIGVIVANVALKPFGLQDTIPRFILAILIAYIFAFSLYEYIERPLLASRPKLFTSRIANRITLVAYLSVILGITLGLLIKN